mgnify:CR=1 FL=1
MTPDQYIQNLATPEPPATTYEVDSMSDDELFCIDLLDKKYEKYFDLSLLYVNESADTIEKLIEYLNEKA